MIVAQDYDVICPHLYFLKQMLKLCRTPTLISSGFSISSNTF